MEAYKETLDLRWSNQIAIKGRKANAKLVDEAAHET